MKKFEYAFLFTELPTLGNEIQYVLTFTLKSLANRPLTVSSSDVEKLIKIYYDFTKLDDKQKQSIIEKWFNDESITPIENE